MIHLIKKSIKCNYVMRKRIPNLKGIDLLEFNGTCQILVKLLNENQIMMVDARNIVKSPNVAANVMQQLLDANLIYIPQTIDRRFTLTEKGKKIASKLSEINQILRTD